MKNFSISVAMCTYNGSKYLNQQLESISSQSLLPNELIVCDDNSSDNTIEIIKNFSKKAPFKVRLYQNSLNLGSTKNFEKAISLCDNEIIVLSDQDDIWEKNKLQRITDEFSKSSAIGGVFSNASLIDENGNLLKGDLWSSVKFKKKEQREAMKGEIFKTLLKHNVVTGATMAFRSEYKNILLPIPKNCIHDEWSALLLSVFSKIVPISDKLICYRIHLNQQIGVSQSLEGELKKTREIGKEEYLKAKKNYEEAKKMIVNHDIIVNKDKLIIKYLDNKINFMEYRAKIHKTNNKLKRVPLVLKNVVNTHYFLYSSGFKSIVKDLFL